MKAEVWKVSLHGGHSGEFCEHAFGTLREILRAAVQAGYHTFGVSEHAPRAEERFIYSSEREKGWDLERLHRDFEAYAGSIQHFSEEFDGQLTVLRGFEAEVIPRDRYAEIMLEYRRHFAFDYMVGSVHYVDEIQIDGSPQLFAKALQRRGGLEQLAVGYYQQVAEMVEALQPEVVGHLDLIRRNSGPYGPVDTPAIREAAQVTLRVIREQGCILDLNTAGYRKGLGCPYPEPWLIRMAQQMGVGFCFGDDSHSPGDVGAGIEEARKYLLQNGVETVTVLTREEGVIRKRVVSLKLATDYTD